MTISRTTYLSRRNDKDIVKLFWGVFFQFLFSRTAGPEKPLMTHIKVFLKFVHKMISGKPYYGF